MADTRNSFHISIHALLAESDRGWTLNINGPMSISIHALLAESDSISRNLRAGRIIFLSTLSLRRATVARSYKNINTRTFLSTLSLRRATAVTIVPACGAHDISIHALLAESDRSYNRSSLRRKRYFYPRSPCGERLIKIRFLFRPPKNFYPRSPCGERLCVGFSSGAKAEFLSTLSLRRATPG